ncbi:MAG: tetratricopeptide repeat protein [Deltaproteobacteria bacterium]
MSSRAWTQLSCSIVLVTVGVVSAPTHAQQGTAQSPTPASQQSAAMRELSRQVALDLEHRASTAERDGQFATAEALWRRAIEADAGYLPAYLGYARLLSARGRIDDAGRVLAVVPGRATQTEHDLVELARGMASLGDLDRALEMLTARADGIEAARARTQLCAQAGRFPEALLAARRLADLSREPGDAREARLLVRALVILVGEADAVRVPGLTAPTWRRSLE